MEPVIARLFQGGGGASTMPRPSIPAGTSEEYVRPFDPENDIAETPSQRLYTPMLERTLQPIQPRKMPVESPADGIEVIDDSSGNAMQRELSFQCHSVLVDNFSNQWLYFPAAGRYVAPYTFGAVLPMPRASQVAQYAIVAPPSITSDTAISGQKIVTTWFGYMMGHSAGTVVGALGGKGNKTTAAIVTVATGSTQILAANPNRKSATFINVGANTIFVGNAGVNNTPGSSSGFPLAAATAGVGGGSFNDTSSIDAWFGAAATGATNLLVFEVT